MTDPWTFSLAVLALLAMPGPTNTLIATSGAAAGFKRSIHLLLAAMLGFALSISLLALVIGPIVRASQALDVGLRIACAMYLLYAAWRLWREGAAAITSDRPVSFRRVFVATALNPKGIVFAFVIVPHLQDGAVVAALPYMGAFLGYSVLVYSVWLAGGAALRAGARSTISAGLARRAGAVVLCVFAALITGSTFTA